MNAPSHGPERTSRNSIDIGSFGALLLSETDVWRFLQKVPSKWLVTVVVVTLTGMVVTLYLASPPPPPLGSQAPLTRLMAQ